MTLPYIAGGDAFGNNVTVGGQFGIVIALFPTSAVHKIEIERAPDSAGSPDTGGSESLDDNISPTERYYVDTVSPAEGPYHYRTRHVPGGDWTCWRGPVYPVLLTPPFNIPPVMPIPREATSMPDATTGHLDLTIEDPQCRLTQVRMKTKSGANVETAYAVVVITGGVYPQDVTLIPGLASTITYELTFYNDVGVLTTLERTVTFSTANVPSILDISCTFDDAGAPTVTIRGDVLTTGLKVAYSDTAFPTDVTVRADTLFVGQEMVDNPAIVIPVGGTLYVSAFAYSSQSAESSPLTTVAFRRTSGLPEGLTLLTKDDERAEPGMAASLRLVDGENSVVTSDLGAGTIQVDVEGADPGIGAGTPGNMSIPLYMGPTLVVPTLAAAVTEHVETKVGGARKYHNFSAVSALRLQASIIQALANSKIALQLSKTGGLTWLYPDLVGGPYVSGGAVAYPQPGDWVTLTATLQANNVLTRLVTLDGDGASPFEFGGVWLDMVSAATPPASPEGDPVAALFEGLFLSDMATYSDVARTTLETTHGNTVQGWGNQVSGATVHGSQSTSAAAPLVDTSVTLGGYRSLAFTNDISNPDHILFDDILTGTTEGTVFLVTKKSVAIGHGSLWTLGGGAGETTIYPDGDGVIKDSALSTIRNVSVTSAETLTDAHIYAVRSTGGAAGWSNWQNGVKIHEIAGSNTYQAGATGDAILGKNGIGDGYTGWVWLFGIITQALSDAEMDERFEAIASRYGMTL